jgi:hypothetical protein
MTDAGFSAALLDPERPVPAGLITPDGKPATRRYAIYRNNVTVGLTEALEAGFPVVRKIVGERFFQAMAVVFVRNHPPASPILAGYGADMPGFLRGFEPVAHLKYLPTWPGSSWRCAGPITRAMRRRSPPMRWPPCRPTG